MSDYSIVEYFGRNVSKCGYCKQVDCSKSNGMWAHSLTVQDYQDLIDRGWRRAGKYCYKPIMQDTCCVLYTIRCAALDLQLSKSQKKIIKNVNKYIAHGIKGVITENEEVQSIASSDQINFRNKPSLSLGEKIQESGGFGTDMEKSMPTTSAILEVSSDTNVSQINQETTKSVKKGVGADLSKPPCKKAKLLRLERRNAKLASKGLPIAKTAVSNCVVKSVEEFINDIPENALHKLKCLLVSTRSRTFLETLSNSHRIYVKYQMKIHNDSASDCDFQNYKEFLCDSPLKSCGDFGSYHQQYYLDGKLIAVGVIDILPNCVSSVYFYYDPDYGHMSLGTYGSLRELVLTRQLHQTYPDLKYYYMGYYINTCQKMRYKAKLNPSFLLCPFAYTWHPIEKCLPKIEAAPFQRLSDETQSDINNCSEEDINKISILYESTVIPYQIYAKNKRRVVDSKEVQEYASLVGKNVSKRVLLYRQ